MSLVFLKRIVFGSHSEPSRSRETARSYRLYKKDLEIGTATTHSSSSSSSSQHDEPLLSKSEGIFDPDPRPPTRSSTRIISDATIGLSDGLTVPFALSAGLSALGNTKVVIYAGIAELIAGAISMGLGGYLAARSEAESYIATLTSTHHLLTTSPTHAHSPAPSSTPTTSPPQLFPPSSRTSPSRPLPTSPPSSSASTTASPSPPTPAPTCPPPPSRSPTFSAACSPCSHTSSSAKTKSRGLFGGAWA